MKPEPIYRERLLRLAEFLDTVESHRFNYGYWVGLDWAGREDLSCGTVACALGWATTIPEFRDLGLRLVRTEDGCVGPVLEGDSPAVWPATDRAAAHVFGLTADETSYLFRPDEGGPPGLGWPEQPELTASAKTVANHIRRFLDECVPLAGTAQETK